MGHAADATTIRNQFNSQWPIEQPTVVFKFSDVDYKPDIDEPWVRLTILPGTQTQVSMGAVRRFRRIGVIIVQIFVPAGSGDGLARELADSVANIYQGRTINGVICRGTGLDRVGVEGAWSMWNAGTPYQADDCVAIT